MPEHFKNQRVVEEALNLHPCPSGLFFLFSRFVELEHSLEPIVDTSRSLYIYLSPLVSLPRVCLSRAMTKQFFAKILRDFSIQIIRHYFRDNVPKKISTIFYSNLHIHCVYPIQNTYSRFIPSLSAWEFVLETAGNCSNSEGILLFWLSINFPVQHGMNFHIYFDNYFSMKTSKF